MLQPKLAGNGNNVWCLFNIGLSELLKVNRLPASLNGMYPFSLPCSFLVIISHSSQYWLPRQWSLGHFLKVPQISFLSLLLVCMYMLGKEHATAHMWRPQDSLWTPVLSTMWVLRIKLRPSDLMATSWPTEPSCQPQKCQGTYLWNLKSAFPQQVLGNTQVMEGPLSRGSRRSRHWTSWFLKAILPKAGGLLILCVWTCNISPLACPLA